MRAKTFSVLTGPPSHVFSLAEGAVVRAQVLGETARVISIVEGTIEGSEIPVSNLLPMQDFLAEVVNRDIGVCADLVLHGVNADDAVRRFRKRCPQGAVLSIEAL
jgi:hypothetical protein